MIDFKLSEKLDNLLRMYYNNASTAGEKSNAMSLFEKLCKKNDVDHTSYILKSRANPINEKKQVNSRNKKWSPNQSNKKTADWANWDDFWNNFHKEDDSKQYNPYEDEKKRKEEETQREEQKRKDDEKQRNTWKANQHGQREFEMRAPIWEVRIHNGKRVILLWTEVRSKGTQNRWGTENYCIYSDNFNPEKCFSNKEEIFIIVSGKVQYFRDHYIVKKLYRLENGREIPIN